MDDSLVLLGTFVDSKDAKKICIVEDGILVAVNGKIRLIEPLAGREPAAIAAEAGVNYKKSKQIHLRAEEFLIPGLIDTHLHAPQFPNTGLGYDCELLEWLSRYTFPLESKYKDAEFADLVYHDVVRNTLNSGTTLACYFATLYGDSSLQLAKIASELGQRAFIGKVNMNMNTPEFYSETTEQSLNDTERFVDSVLALQNPLVQPIITPRFAVSCDTDLLSKLGKMAKERDLHIQTHISENRDEIAFVRKLFPNSKNYADVYDQAGLLGKKTILAHGVHLENDEVALLAKRQTGIAHCPTSNTNLQSGLCHVRRLLDAGIRVGLGTDISGGHNPCLLEVLRAAIATSIHIKFAEKAHSHSVLSYHEVFYLATLGGAQALAMDDVVGNFEVGKELDALVVTTPSAKHRNLSPLERLQKFLHLGDDRHILHVLVNGRSVK